MIKESKMFLLFLFQKSMESASLILPLLKIDMDPRRNHYWIWLLRSFPGGSVVQNPPANTGDTGSIFGLERYPGGGRGNTLQDSCLENPMQRGAWRARVQGSQSRTWLRNWAHTHKPASSQSHSLQGEEYFWQPCSFKPPSGETLPCLRIKVQTLHIPQLYYLLSGNRKITLSFYISAMSQLIQ